MAAKSSGIDSCLCKYVPTAKDLADLSDPLSTKIRCNANSSCGGTPPKNRYCFSGRDQKCLSIIVLIKSWISFGVTCPVQVGISVVAIGRPGYICKTSDP